MRIVISDLDGTLLSSKKQLDPLAAEALDELARRGIEFVPASGRPLAGLPDELLDHPSVHYAVCGNGALIYRINGRKASGELDAELLHSEPMSRSSLLALWDLMHERFVLFDVFCDGVAYGERSRYEHVNEFGIDPAFVPTLVRSRTLTELEIPQLIEGFDEVQRLTVFWRDRADRDALVAAVEASPELVWVNSLPTNVEVSSVRATKGLALQFICKRMGVDVSESVAFGDGNNDIPMLEVAGDGVAVANADDEVKAAANHVCGDNDAPGVALYLRELLGM